MEFSKYEKSEMLREIKNFFHKERDEEIGDLGAELILDFISNKLGKYYFNQGVKEAKKFVIERLEEISDIEN